ncbi:SGNH/GDSL hydrolase family protein [Olivibacter sp. CPCC 100613]|uniref:SGNH/GDSL hydrolase family protein n=1 Tax=Olivibacter sp. CPCC 100613 TaxID=3079931 RepID=UPI002FFBEF1C
MLKKFLILYVAFFVALESTWGRATLCTPLPSTLIAPSKAEKQDSVLFFPPDSLIQPSGTSVIILATAAHKAQLDILMDSIRHFGVAVMKPSYKAEFTEGDIHSCMQVFESQSSKYSLSDKKICLLTMGAEIQMNSDLSGLGADGLINLALWPADLPKGSAMMTIAQAKNKQAIKRYHHWVKEGRAVELHLHAAAVTRGAIVQEIKHWLAGNGLLVPVKEDKTDALKRKEAWDNWLKMLDDRLRNDWAWLNRYEQDNKNLMPKGKQKRVVFIGNSITEGWLEKDPSFFTSSGYINRGIGGQTSPQLLVRFRQDVVDLKPDVVVILAGINDIAENTGPTKIENVAGNIMSMTEIARANNIQVIICAVLPALRFSWHPEINPVQSIRELNQVLKAFAKKEGYPFVDYYHAMLDERQGLKDKLSEDGVHPNLAGYKIMEPLVEKAIQKLLTKKK